MCAFCILSLVYVFLFRKSAQNGKKLFKTLHGFKQKVNKLKPNMIRGPSLLVM